MIMPAREEDNSLESGPENVTIVYSELEKVGTKDRFYQDALSYWSKIPPTVDGMLGGFSYITKTDVKGSSAFIKDLMNSERTGRSRALDCGAGIGRVTRNLLLPLFDTVDLLEFNKKFLDEAPDYIGFENGRVGEYICQGMQEFTPSHKYDVVWCQWVVGHLTDKHLAEFLQRCRESLNPNGLICIKDNVARTRQFDGEDSSFTRSLPEMKKVIENAGMTIVKEKLQEGFPVSLYDVPMIAFR